MKVSLIAEMLVGKDAISSSTRSKAFAIREICADRGIDLELRLFVTACGDAAGGGEAGYPGAAGYGGLGGCVKKVVSVNEIAFDPHFLSSNLIVYDFGIYSALFDSIHLAPASSTTIVHYHNITPAEYAAEYN